jgi:hypothetical protein
MVNTERVKGHTSNVMPSDKSASRTGNGVAIMNLERAGISTILALLRQSGCTEMVESPEFKQLENIKNQSQDTI